MTDKQNTLLRQLERAERAVREAQASIENADYVDAIDWLATVTIRTGEAVAAMMPDVLNRYPA
jgi:hypothetical protein